MPGAVFAASHREAPLIARDPGADNTDVFAFVSPDDPETVTLIANYSPFQEPNGGPNFFGFDENVSYWMKVDNDGDGDADQTFTFDFDRTVANGETFLYNTNTVSGDDYENLNVRQTYSVTQNETEIGTGIPVPPDNIGPRSTPDYEKLAASAVTELDNGMTVFAGQRDDPFFVDLGSIFDLGGLRPFNMAHLAPLKTAKGEDGLGSFNVSSIAIQVPITELTRDGESVADAKAENAVVGIWAGASRPSNVVLSAGGDEVSGDLVQVSRMGNPLINEVIIPLAQKDEWNRSEPSGDSEYEDRYLKPELAGLVNLLYPSLPDTRTEDRTDLVLILLQGVPGLNSTGDGKYDMLRLNMGIPPTASPSRLGVLAGDLAGFPNGRRLWDDVTDIELRAVADGYGTFLNKNFDLPNLSPNNQVGDGCDANDVAFTKSFPYLATPHQGYDHAAHHRPCGGKQPASDMASPTAAASLGAWLAAIIR
ncbi:MAG: DUF4331 domain-containing protein [Chloroflexi bacterium]|nr:DUF4331 domain-containing protein [Chloroflexota bacterium]